MKGWATILQPSATAQRITHTGQGWFPWEERAVQTENQEQPPQNAVGVNDCYFKPPALEALLLRSMTESIAN